VELNAVWFAIATGIICLLIGTSSSHLSSISGVKGVRPAVDIQRGICNCLLYLNLATRGHDSIEKQASQERATTEHMVPQVHQI